VNLNQQWIDSKFEGLTAAELREAGAAIGVNFAPNTSVATMRHRLLEKLGEGPTLPPKQENDTTAPPVRMTRRMQRPKLAPGDKWEGRRHRVILHRTQEQENHKSCLLYWNFAAATFPFDEPIDMPYPYYYRLKTAKNPRVVQEPVMTDLPEGGKMRTGTINKVIETQKFTFTDMGVTPGTEHLPVDILNYWQMEARNNDYFRKMRDSTSGRHRLIQIRSDLIGSAGVAYFKDLTNEDIWQEVIRFLGFEDIFYEEEVAA
jgi:hypothetical protein